MSCAARQRRDQGGEASLAPSQHQAPPETPDKILSKVDLNPSRAVPLLIFIHKGQVILESRDAQLRILQTKTIKALPVITHEHCVPSLECEMLSALDPRIPLLCFRPVRYGMLSNLNLRSTSTPSFIHHNFGHHPRRLQRNKRNLVRR